MAAAPPAIERISFRSEQPEDQPFLCRLYASTRTEEMALTGWPVEQRESIFAAALPVSNAALPPLLQRDVRNHSSGRAPDRTHLRFTIGADDIRLMDIALLPESAPASALGLCAISSMSPPVRKSR
jgi:hypothetical protein